jgi:hypothetical protein
VGLSPDGALAKDTVLGGFRGMMRGSGVVIPGMVAKLLAFAGELPSPRIALEVNRPLLRSL